MIISRTCIILLIIASSFTCAVKSTYNIKKITGSIGYNLETPNWSVEEQTLYFIDFSRNTFFRLNGATCKVTSEYIGNYGVLGLIIPLKGSPGYVIVAIKSSLYIMKCNAPNVGESLRLLTTVDLGKPDNIIHDAKVDAAGRLWFGTLGKPLSSSAVEPDQGSLYVISNETYTTPRVALRPVSLSDGLVWSLTNDKFYYNDAPTRKISRFDYNLKKGEIVNRTTFFDFEENSIAGFPNGMTIDSDGNIWVATFGGAEILRIDAVTRKVLLRIKLPVDQVTSIIWGGKNLDILYATTGRFLVTNPKPHSGSLFGITAKGCRGMPQNYMRMDGVENY